jgi:hypothetical protein
MAMLTELNVGQGETFRILVTVSDSGTDTPLNLQNYNITGQVRENYTTDEIAATFSTIKMSPNSSGSFILALTQEQTLQLDQRKYVYDVLLSSGSVTPTTRRILEGPFTVRPAVTR